MTTRIKRSLVATEGVQLTLGDVAISPGQARRYPATPPPPTEHAEQAALIRRAWDRAAVDETADDLALLFAVPNGGDRHPAVAAKLKAEGVQPGIPDLQLPVARGRHPTDPPAPLNTPQGWWIGLFIELKRIKGGRVSPEQERWHTHLREQGYRVEVCYGADAAWQVLCDYLDLPCSYHSYVV